MRLKRVYDFQRAACEDPEFIHEWFKLVHNIMAKYGITDSDLYNFNKTGFIMGVTCGSLIIITRVNR